MGRTSQLTRFPLMKIDKDRVAIVLGNDLQIAIGSTVTSISDSLRKTMGKSSHAWRP
jgi:hypothetical protein